MALPEDSWHNCITWFQDYAADDAYSWAEFFVHALEDSREEAVAKGLYAHRWAVAVGVSRFGEDDWSIGPLIELNARPGNRIEITHFKPYRQKKAKEVISYPEEKERLMWWMEFVARSL